MVIAEPYRFSIGFIFLLHRYKLKGILNIIFYAPPDHAVFYSEFLAFPFLAPDVDAADVTSKVLYSRYDAMALERLVGTREATAMIKR